ncbi:MAG: glycosyltransferase family 1 protein [Bacteroidota bacterium]
MIDSHLHIVSFDVPYPPNYGGVIDVFYKINSLAKLGVKIHLHCFKYGREEAAILEEYCEEVHYYKRNLNKALLIHSSPFIVVSRRDKKLLKNLRKDEYPILFEGLHSCFSFSSIALRARRKYIRAHNIEHRYYRGLAHATSSLFRKSYFKSEARKLESFEGIMKDAQKIFSISPSEKEELSSRYSNVELILPFHGNEEVVYSELKDPFVLYHGNLSVEENNKAALFLVKEVFRSIPHRLIIAGNNPSRELTEAIERRENVTIKDHCSNAQIFDLIRQAQINILPTFQNTGIKLKLINVLFNGGHCLVNSMMIAKTGLEDCCVIEDKIENIRESIAHLMVKPFDKIDYEKRKVILFEKLSDELNAQKLYDSIFKA